MDSLRAVLIALCHYGMHEDDFKIHNNFETSQ